MSSDDKATELEFTEETAEVEKIPMVPAEAPVAPRELTPLDHDWQKAKALSMSDIVPDDFKNKPANCYLAMELAHRMDASILEVMQNLYLVHGNPGWKATYMIGQANRFGPFKGGLQFTTTEMEGDTAVECWAIHRETGERLASTVTLEMARENGWTTRKGNLYGKLTVQMLSYRAATFFIRLHCPEVLFGMHTVDELEDIGPREVEVEMSDARASLQAQLAAAEGDEEE